MTHVIKIQKGFAQAVYFGEKTFEVRNNDRGYQKGDLVKFQVMDGMMARPTHPLNDMTFEITYVLGSFVGLTPNYVAFGIREAEADTPQTEREGEWILCSERLPENSAVVLVQVDDIYHTTDTNNGILTGWRRGDYWYTFTIRGCETIRYPLAWMPLPKPWKGTDDEKL